MFALHSHSKLDCHILQITEKENIEANLLRKYNQPKIF